MIPVVIGVLGTIYKELVKRSGRHRIKRRSEDYQDYNIIKISQNTEKSPGDLKSLPETQNLREKHQLTLI